jgi:hypothetical protein
VVGEAADLVVGVVEGFSDEGPHVGIAGSVQDVPARFAGLDQAAQAEPAEVLRHGGSVDPDPLGQGGDATTWLATVTASWRACNGLLAVEKQRRPVVADAQSGQT